MITVATPASPVVAAPKPAVQPCPAELPDEQAALTTARICGGPVTIANLTSPTDEAIATPSGAVELKHNFRPVRVRQGKTWVPVNTDLEITADGRVAPKAAAAAVTFSGGGTGDMVRITDGKTFVGLASPVGELPPPELGTTATDRDTATYREVLPGVDLKLRADVDGYSQVLVVKTAQAATNNELRRLSFKMNGKGLTLRADKAGNLRATNAQGKLVLTGSTPLMWDAATEAAHGNAPTAGGAKGRSGSPSGVRHGRVRMPAEVSAGHLSITPNQQVLSDPATVYPVSIDPGLTVNRAGFAIVNSGSPDTSFWNSTEDAYVGSWDGGTSKFRSLFSYDLTGSNLAGKYISSAQLNLYEKYAGTCQPAAFEVWSTDLPTSSSTWNNQPAWYSQQSTSTVTKGYSTSGMGGPSDCPAGTVPMAVTSYLQSAADNGWNGIALGVRSTSETDANSWKRFSNNPTLSITYTAYPTTSALSTAPSAPCTTGTGRPYLNTLTPQLQARISDAEGALVRPEFSWSTTTGAPVGSAQPTPGQASGQTFATTIPAGHLANNGSYAWKVRGNDGTTWGPWSVLCEFTVDATAPTSAPTVSSTTYPSGSWAGATGTAGTFTFGASSTGDVAAYVYSLDTDFPTTVNAATLGGSASISLTPTADGPHTLQVQSVDRGGNLSPATSYAFNVGTGAVTAPALGTQTASKVTLSGVSKTTSSGITYQWRRGDADTWTTIPAADVATTGGGTITWPVATTGSGNYPNLVWNVSQTLNNAEAGPAALNGPVQVRASLSGTSTGTSTSRAFTFDADRTEAASSQIGPGSVNLLTGNYTVSATDASTVGGLGVQRSFNSRLAADSDPMFGPGWTSSIGVPDAGTYTDLTVTGGLVQVGLADGSTLGFTKTASITGGATFTAEVGAEGTTLAYTSTGDTYKLTEESGDAVTFSRRTGDPAGLYTPSAMQAAGTTAGGSNVSWAKVTIGSVDVVRPTQVLAPVPTGVASCATLVKGCRALTFTYATTTTASGSTLGDYTGRLKQVGLTAWDPDLGTPAMRTVTMAQFSYDSTGRLRRSWDPRLDYTSGGTQNLATAYTYNTDGTLATLTSPGEQAWSFTYTTLPTDSGAGRLYKVSRSALTAGTSVQTVIYNVPVSGTGAPVDMAANIARWGQTAVPVDATSVYPGDIVPDGNPATGTPPTFRDDDRVTVTYMDPNGRTTNTMYPGGTVDATFFDAYGNVIRELSAGNLADALYTSTTDTTTQEAALARTESTLYTYSNDGQRVLETLAPEQQNVRLDWDMVRGRTHTTYTYDEGAPSGGPYNLVTTQVEAMQYTVNGATVDTDKRTATTQYDWTLRQPTSRTTDPNGLALAERASYDSTTGLVISTTTPAGNTGGTTPATRKTAYYRAGTGSGFTECDNHPEWALMPCRTYAAAQPGTGNEIPYTITTYDMYGSPRTIQDKNSTTTLRTTTIDHDAASRPTDVTISSSVGTAISKRRNVYQQATGYLSDTQALDGTGAVTASVTRAFDTLGRITSYTDADANTSTTTYDLLSRPATTNDGKATRTISYNGSGEKRGLPTQVVDSQAGTFTATYDSGGNLDTETRPDGVTVRHYYNENKQATGLEYVTSPSCSSSSCTLYYDYADFDSHGKARWDSSSFSNSGYGYDAAGRLTGVRQDTATGCALRDYKFDNASNRTALTTYGPDTSGNCQDSNPAITRTWTYDTADRTINGGYTYDTLGRTLTLPDDDTVAGDGAGDVTNTYHTNDLVRTISQGSTTATYTLDVLTNRFRSYSTTTSGTTATRTNHYSSDSDSPSWIAEGAWYTRVIPGLAGMAAQYTGSSAHLEWQITNLHGDIVATRNAGSSGITATFITDEYGKSATVGGPRYGYLGNAQRSADNPGGLVLMGLRLYNPTTGRFLSRDSIYGGNENPYVYPVDPVNQSDTTGQIALPLAAAALLVGAVIIGMIVYYIAKALRNVQGTSVHVPFPSAVAWSAIRYAFEWYIVYEIATRGGQTWKYGISRQVEWNKRPGGQITACQTYFRATCVWKIRAFAKGWFTARFEEASLFFAYVVRWKTCPPGALACI